MMFDDVNYGQYNTYVLRKKDQIDEEEESVTSQS